MLCGKYGCAVTTTGSSGDSEVLHYMNFFLNQLGALTVGQIGVAVGRNPAALDAAITEASDLGETLADAILKKRRYPDQESTIAERGAFFRQLIEANKEAWAHQYEYWMDKGWV
jgi:hypothetical protein